MEPISLQLGWPSPSLLPRELLSAAAAKLLLDSPLASEALLYGPDPGSEPLRRLVGEWLTKFYQPKAGHVAGERIFIANGASAALGIMLEKYTDMNVTKCIWMIEPTYFMACPMFEDAGFVGRLRGVPEDEEGIDIGFLTAALQKADETQDAPTSPEKSPIKNTAGYPKLYKHIIYVVPTFSNPSGKVMSLRRRQQLVRLARKHDALIVADDVYDMLRWPTDPDVSVDQLPPAPPRMVDVDRSMAGCTEFGNACSNGSFSKIVAPGTRVSWVEGTKDFIYNLSTHGFTKSGGSPGQMTSLMIFHMLESGVLDSHLKTKIIPTYRSRYAAMRKAIESHLQPLGVRVIGGLPVVWTPEGTPDDRSETKTPEVAQAGGFFTYIMFPDDLPSAAEITKIALRSYALKIPGGQRMVAAGDSESVKRCETTFGRGARLSWSWLEEDKISEGIERLAMVLKDIRSGTVKPELPQEQISSLMAN